VGLPVVPEHPNPSVALQEFSVQAGDYSFDLAARAGMRLGLKCAPA